MLVEYGIIAVSGVVGLVATIWLIVVGFRVSQGWGFALLLSYLGNVLVVVIPLLGLVFPLLWLVIFIVFVIKYWRDAKFPALVIIASIVLQIGVGLALVSKIKPVVEEVQHKLDNGEMSRDEAGEYILRRILGQEEAPQKTEEQKPPVRLPQSLEDKALDQLEEEAPKSETPAQETSGETAVPDARNNGPQSETQTTTAARETATTEKPAEQDISVVPPDPLAVKVPDKPPPATRVVPLSQARNYIGDYFMIEDKKDLMHEGRLRRITDNSLEFERKVYNGEFSFQLKRSDIRRLRLRLDMPKEAK